MDSSEARIARLQPLRATGCPSGLHGLTPARCLSSLTRERMIRDRFKRLDEERLVFTFVALPRS
jgi:hypothetical protein